MHEIQLVVRPGSEPSHASFARRVEAELVCSLLRMDPARLETIITRRPPPRLAPIRFCRAPVAVVSC